jgi:hypothetical protein
MREVPFPGLPLSDPSGTGPPVRAIFEGQDEREEFAAVELREHLLLYRIFCGVGVRFTPHTPPRIQKEAEQSAKLAVESPGLYLSFPNLPSPLIINDIHITSAVPANFRPKEEAQPIV